MKETKKESVSVPLEEVLLNSKVKEVILEQFGRRVPKKYRENVEINAVGDCDLDSMYPGPLGTLILSYERNLTRDEKLNRERMKRINTRYQEAKERHALKVLLDKYPDMLRSIDSNDTED